MAETTAQELATDPRIRRTRRAVIDAVVAILSTDGAAGVTHQRVARESGVGRATLYRHWPTAADLLYDALAEVDEPLLRAGDGPFFAWLGEELSRISVEIGQPNAVQFHAVLVGRAQFDPGAAELRQQLIDRNARTLEAALARAVASGELLEAPDPVDLLAKLLGPIIFRVVLEARPASTQFIQSVMAGAIDSSDRSQGWPG